LALGREDSIVVAPVRYRSIRALGIPLASCSGHERSERTRRLTIFRRPVEAVALARRACELLRIVEHGIAVGIARVVLALGVDVREGRLDRIQLVLPDAPVDDLLLAGGGVEAPARTVRHERDREREVVTPGDEYDLASTGLELVLLVVRGHEARSRVP